jgi:phage-related protein
VRSNLPTGRIARLIFVIEDREIYIVHGFIKQTQKTPQGDLELAVRRLKATKA